MRERIATGAKWLAVAGGFAAFLALLLLKFVWSVWSAEVLLLGAGAGAVICIIGVAVAKAAGNEKSRSET